ncbi:MAG: adenosylcobinamide-phosphate synthase CbiB [Anaerovoracaceae bacterium]
MIYLIPLASGFLLDLLIGDPQGFPHPIRFIGKLIEVGEKIIRKCLPKTKTGELLGGGILVIFVIAVSFAIPLGLLFLAWMIHPGVAIGLETIMCYQILAVKSLKTESMKVYKKLEEKDLHGARHEISMIVGRDTDRLNEEEIGKAAIETIAENTADGTVAPMIFMAIGGAPLGFLYKAINTMDSMIGYKNDMYLYFGRVAARLDDVANFVPSRISAWIMIFASWILRLDYRNAFKIFKRDRFNHSSMNSAQTEAVCAGALGIELGGDAYYFGERYTKKTIGNNIKPAENNDILLANRLLYAAAIICLILCLGAKALVMYLI